MDINKITGVSRNSLLEARIQDLERFKAEAVDFKPSFGITHLLEVIFYLLEQKRAIETQAVGETREDQASEASLPLMWELCEDGIRRVIVLKAPETKPRID